MYKLLSFIVFFTIIAIWSAPDGGRSQQAEQRTEWDAEQTRREVAASVAHMKLMNEIEAKQAAREEALVKEFEEADRSDWHPPYEPTEE